MNQAPDDEIGLFEFFETIWDGRLTIGIFVLVTVLLSIVFMNLKPPIYESRLIYQVDTMPPFYDVADQRIAMRDFRKFFYSKNFFDEWKENNKNSELTYDDFSESQNIDGFMLSKHEDNRTAILDKDDKIGAFVLIRTERLELLDDFFNYTNYINKTLTNEYVSRAKEEINIISKRFTDFSSTTDIITSKLLAIDRYIVEANSGANVLILMRPSYPDQVFPRVPLILAIAVILGLIIGIIYIFVRDASRMRKEHMTKSRENS